MPSRLLFGQRVTRASKAVGVQPVVQAISKRQAVERALDLLESKA